MLKSRIHQATVSEAQSQGEDCLYLDREIMKKADLWPFELVEVCNHDNGARFRIPVQDLEPGSGRVVVQGAAAHLARPGQKLTVLSFVQLSEAELAAYRPRTVVLDGRNQLRG